MNARSALISDQDVVVAIHAPEFCLLALSMSLLDGRWSANPDYSQWQILTYVSNGSSIAIESNHSIETQSMLRLDTFGGVEGPWVLALHSYVPTWRKGETVPEIIVVAYDRTNTKRLLTYNAQLTPAQENEAPYGNQKQRLRLIAQGCALADAVPWNPNCITNSGRMVSLRDNLLAFSPFTNAKQPSKVIEIGMDVHPEREATTSAVEPYSGAIVIGTPGLVRVLHFD